MAKRTNSNSPQNRGLILAVSLFSLAVLAGAAWILHREDPIVLPGNARSFTPEFPQFRPARAAADSSPVLGLRSASTEDRFASNHRARGAVVGRAAVYRGDLVQVEGAYFRLVDIDEIAGYQHCGPSMYRWACGTTPQQALSMRVGDDQVACYNRGYNAQGEQLGQCFVDNIDLGGWMVEHGMARAASSRTDYNIKQTTARREGRGWWHTQR